MQIGVVVLLLAVSAPALLVAILQQNGAGGNGDRLAEL
jgi:hypothetical protein